MEAEIFSCARYKRAGRINGFMLVESLLALLVLCLCSFLLAGSLAAYRSVLSKGVNPKIEEREHAPKPQI